MNIAVKGSQERTIELDGILTSVGLSFTRLESTKNIHSSKFDLIFDLNFDDDASSLSDYALLDASSLLLLSTVKIQLESVLPKAMWAHTIGINALPSFLKRNALEYCALSNELTDQKLSILPWKTLNKVDSRVGMISARVVCMVINEAYFTLQEGTANRIDIDLGMKLGTAYPYGPFEWCDMIGIQHVYEVLNALYLDTHDDRYKICSLLKTEYLKNQAI
jgi:3-hydroxybutyryl-CoA dehydrogenase